LADFVVVEEKEAPRPIAKTTGRLAERKRQYDQYMTILKKGQVGKLAPDNGETARGIALRISRAASRLNKPTDTWVVDGIVYFKHT
jgi:hypothetical protein